MPKSDFSHSTLYLRRYHGLSKFVDGEHYFDTLADDVLFEFLYEFPGWPRVTRGREVMPPAEPLGLATLALGLEV
jgi:hypothetical protein